MASFDQEITNELKSRFGDNIMDRIENAYRLGQVVVDRAELEQLHEAARTNDLVAVSNLIQEFMSQYTGMPQVVASFGNDWVPLQNLIKAYRHDHLDDDNDNLFSEAVGYIMAGFDQEITGLLKSEFGNDIMSKIQRAYYMGQHVVTRSELEQVHEAALNNDLAAIHNFVQHFMSKLPQLPQVVAFFGDDWVPMQKLIRAYRLGHLEGDVNLFEEAVGYIMAGFDVDIRGQLKANFGADIMDRIEAAYRLGQAVVDRDELNALHEAARTNDLPAVSSLIQEFMSQYTGMPAVVASFGADWEPMQEMIIAYRHGHIVDNVDIFQQALSALMSTFDAPMVELLKANFGDNIMDRIRAAYGLGRTVVDRDELVAFHNALDNNDYVAVQQQLLSFFAQYSGMPEVIASFGSDWNPLQRLIKAYRMNHLDENNSNLFEEAVGYIMQGFDQEISNLLKTNFGDDIMTKIENAYYMGQHVVTRSELDEVHAAALNNNLAAIHNFVQHFMAKLPQLEDVIAYFGNDWVPMQKMIRAYRLGHLEGDVNLFEEAIGYIMAGFDAGIRQQLKDSFGDNIMERIEAAYHLGQGVVDRIELDQLHEAARINDLPTVQNLIQEFMSQYTGMPAVVASFGADWEPMQQMIADYRNNN